MGMNRTSLHGYWHTFWLPRACWDEPVNVLNVLVNNEDNPAHAGMNRTLPMRRMMVILLTPYNGDEPAIWYQQNYQGGINPAVAGMNQTVQSNMADLNGITPRMRG